MFNKPIYSTALTDETTDRLFSNITASGAPDQSFLATLRALLHKRLPSNETVRLSCKAVHVSENAISIATPSQRMSCFIPDSLKYLTESEHNICIVYTVYTNVGEKMLETVRANVGTGKRHMSNYTRRDDLKVFYARNLNALFYTDDTEKNTVIFTDKLDLKHFHALQMMLPKYLPCLFTDNSLTEKETALLKSLGNKSAVDYEMLIEEFINDLDIRSEIIRTKLMGFETAYERVRLNEIQNEIDTYQNSYNSHMTAARDIFQTIQDRQYMLAGLACAVNEHSGDSELMEYFMCNKNLSIIRVNGSMIEFVAHGYADVYDEDAFEMYVGNHGGFMYNNINSTVTKSQMEKLYRSIFNDGIYKLRMCAAYSADIRTGLRALAHYMFPPESRTYLPNPHIQQFGCIGSYAARFQEYMQKHDYVGAIDQAVVSARNLNFYDSAIISALGKDLSYTSVKCLEKTDGTLLSPLEAIREQEGGDR